MSNLHFFGKSKPSVQTMLDISRWTEEGGSYRTVQRFFKEDLKWPLLRWQLVRQRVKAGRGVWLLLGDEVVVIKSGKATHGLGKFFSSAADRAVPGLNTLVSVSYSRNIGFNAGFTGQPGYH
jgi:hypothetical protein